MDSTLTTDYVYAGASFGALGNTAKSSSPQHDRKAKAKRAQRYAALSTAREWLGRRASQIDPEKNPGDVFRTHDCRWARRSEYVGVHFSALHQSAHYGNLATCGSVWACPVCCALIQQRRRPEVAALVQWAYGCASSEGPKRPGEPQMVTLTFPHTKFDSLADLLSKQRDAFKRLRSGKVWQEFKRRYGFDGLVRSLELTHGKNGWHPHTHELWITRPLSKRERGDFQAFILERWIRACSAAGLLDLTDRAQLHAFHLRSVDVRFQVNDSDYLAKQDSGRAWGVDRELATSSIKAGRLSGVHPHEFLIRQARGDFDLFLEYVQAMKGARQLYWSSRLKGRVEVEEVEDEVLADAQTEAADLLGLLTADQWRVVRGNDARAELLDAAETGDWSIVVALLRSLGCDLPAHPVNPLDQVDFLAFL